MKPAAHDKFWDFSVNNEGYEPFMYCDILNLVTTGIGNLIDASDRNSYTVSAKAMAPAMSLPWRISGRLATPQEIADCWTLVKLYDQNNPGFNKGGGGRYGKIPGNVCRLDESDIKNLFYSKLAQNEGVLRKWFTNYDNLPADAQFAINSMAWAMGANFPQTFVLFRSAVNAGDFATAAANSHCVGCSNVRNNTAKDLLNSAASGADPNVLHLVVPPSKSPITPPTPPTPPLPPAPPAAAQSGGSILPALGAAIVGVVGGLYLLRDRK